MPLFMDIHTVAGASAKDVAGAHEKDLATQAKHGVRYLKYWHDPKAGKIFCLVDAPSAEAAAAVHRDAHGLVADEIFPVEEHGQFRPRTDVISAGSRQRFEKPSLRLVGTASRAEFVDDFAHVLGAVLRDDQ